LAYEDVNDSFSDKDPSQIDGSRAQACGAPPHYPIY
jgi:hypothetical protein